MGLFPTEMMPCSGRAPAIARMPALGQVFFLDRAAIGADLRGECWGDFEQCASSTFSLGFTHIYKHSPTRVENGFIETAFSCRPIRQ